MFSPTSAAFVSRAATSPMVSAAWSAPACGQLSSSLTGLAKNRGQLSNAAQQVGMRHAAECIEVVRAAQHSDNPAGAGIGGCLQVQGCVADNRHPANILRTNIDHALI